MNERIQALLAFVYGKDAATRLAPRLAALLDTYRTLPAVQADGTDPRPFYFDERDAVLITYGDMVHAPGQRPLQTLRRFLEKRVGGIVRGVHLLPFYPYTSDDGFSVVDYLAVDPALGTWGDVEAFRPTFRLMFDAVINHISQESRWFQGFLRGEAPYVDYFVEMAPDVDLTAVFRPRALPLLSPKETATGTKYVWTTFSDDQIDLNYASPDLLLDVLRVLLDYAAHGAAFIRLDAIGFMWKEPGTRSLHLPQTHALIQLMRLVLDEVAPQVVIVTETNVPHAENISYFGNGRNEAQMVYNFSLPPLTLHAFHTAHAGILTQWANTLTLPSDRVTFFNFLASHDGIGLTPARGLLPATAVAAMAERVQRLGGQVSFRNNPDGTRSAYELNVNYLDALGDPDRPGEDVALVTQRFLASQAIMLALRGVPGIYFHSLFGSRGWPEGMTVTGRARTINRQKLDVATLNAELDTPGSLRARVFDRMRIMLAARAAAPAFHPNGAQHVPALDAAVFAVERISPDGRDRVLCLQNVAAAPRTVSLPHGRYRDILDPQRAPVSGTLTLAPYAVHWLRPQA